MAAPIDELDAVVEMIGIAEADMCMMIIGQEGFTQLEDLAVLISDRDVDEMAKRMATRTQAKGRVLLGTVQCMKTLVWWVADQMKCGLTLAVDNFTADVINWVANEKVLRKELANMEPSITDLGKFDPDDFDAHEDAFLNLLLGQTYGVLKEPL